MSAALLGFMAVLLLLVLVMSKKVSPMVALILVPVVMALVGGHGLKISEYITDGIKTIAPTGVMFIFAILFFGILSDAGTFKPIIFRLLKMAGNDPAKVAVASALLAMLVHLDGSGAVTFLVTVPALLPVYDTLKMKRTTLACVVALGAGTMNILPWGGPTIRAASALEVPVTALFNPLLLPVIGGLIAVLIIAWFLGKAERNLVSKTTVILNESQEISPLERPKLFWFNIGFILLSIGILISGILPPHVVFMLAFVIALMVNYPGIKQQSERINDHAKAALLMAGILFAAGCFTGIMKGAGMIDAMAEASINVIPDAVGAHLPFITGLVSMPASMLFDPDSFYFGILPLLSETSVHFGADAVEVGRAAILGQMTTGFPVSPLTGSTFLLIGLAGVDLGEHQLRTIPYALIVTWIMLALALLVGAISF